MKFIPTADSDVGLVKETNQDSVVIKHARFQNEEILMAVVCDGMGGLSKGELASATVVRAFRKWFDEELAYELTNPDMNVIGSKWSYMLKDLNADILSKSKTLGTSMGTTFTGILFYQKYYVIVHVGDTRAYHIGSGLEQLTNDHTFVAREIRNGTMTPEQARTDKRRNMLLQCVGASESIEPDIVVGEIQKGVYMLCSDGFRHEITEKEILAAFNPKKLKNKDVMHLNAKELIEKNKSRQEKDNITVVLIKTE